MQRDSLAAAALFGLRRHHVLLEYHLQRPGFSRPSYGVIDATASGRARTSRSLAEAGKVLDITN